MIKNTTTLTRSDLNVGDIVKTGDLSSHHVVYRITDKHLDGSPLLGGGLCKIVIGGTYKHTLGHLYPIYKWETFTRAEA